DEQILRGALSAVVVESLGIHALVRRRKRHVSTVKGVDESLAVMIAAVLGARVPHMDVRVDDKDLLAIFRDVHRFSSRASASPNSPLSSLPTLLGRSNVGQPYICG